MTKFSKIVLITLSVLLLSWALPWGYHFVADRPQRTPFTLYSCVTHSFAWIDAQDGKSVRQDREGHTYTDREFDSILPLFYYRQLLSEGRLPDTLNGVAVTPQEINRTSFWFRHTPSDVNKKITALYPLLESRSGRVDLEMPSDVFRLNKRIEFIDMKHNRIDEQKSQLFTRALQAKEFHFPARYMQGNPTTRKEYDEGYFLVDRQGKLFHLKQVCGRPFVRRVALPDTVNVQHIFLTEYASRRSFALLSDARHNFYVLTAPDYELKALPIGPFDPARERLTIAADLLNWTVAISDEQGERYTALDAETFARIDTLTYPTASVRQHSWAQWIFPFELHFTSYDDAYVYPRMEAVSAVALVLNALLLVLYLLLVRRRKRKVSYPGVFAIVVFGLFAWIPLTLLR